MTKLKKTKKKQQKNKKRNKQKNPMYIHNCKQKPV